MRAGMLAISDDLTRGAVFQAAKASSGLAIRQNDVTHAGWRRDAVRALEHRGTVAAASIA